MTPFTFGSVCSGIEAASVAWHPLGCHALWLAEIEPFPSAVLAHRFPQVPNLGDMTGIAARIRDGSIEPPDVLVGGTPCQAFSVAGMRGGLSDPRGALTIAYVELANAIDAARAIRGEPPAIIVWENVPGVLSSSDNAFGCFLGGLAGESCELQPPGRKWTDAGCVFGPQRAVAWRILDAQYFGVAQRRRRVFVVASARNGFDPAAVLFEFEGLRRDTPPSREAGEGPAADAPDSAGGRGGSWWDGGQVSQTLDAVLYKGQTMPEKNRFPAVLQPMAAHDVVGAMAANGGTEKKHGFGWGQQDWENGYCQPVLAFPANLSGTQCASTEDLSPSLGAKNPTAVAMPLLEVGKRTGNSTTDPRAGIGIGSETDPMFTLQAGAQHGVAYAIRTAQTSSNGWGVDDNTAYTLDRAQGQAVAAPSAYAFQPRIARNGRGDMGEVVNALTAQAGETGKGDAAPCVALAFAENSRAELRYEAGDGSVTGALKVGGGKPGQSYPVAQVSMRVRRLTPTECERLQGFPDGWTLVPVKGKPAADGPRYKALGNSMAVPCMRWIGFRVCQQLAGGAV